VKTITEELVRKS
jgi:hypothetical protein